MYRVNVYAKNGNWIEAFVGDLEICCNWLRYVITYQWDKAVITKITKAIPD